MKRFFLFCSGANTTVLRSCPTDESKYVQIGATILLTAIFASLSGGYALFSVFRSIPLAAVFGVLWGVVIFNLDRVIVSGMRKQNRFALDLLYAVPRFAISFLLAVVISRPLELKFFEVEIRDRWERMQADTRRDHIARIRGNDEERLNELRAENARLKEEVEAKRREFDARNTAWMQEREGTAGTGIPGAGPVFAEKDTLRREAERQMKEMELTNLPQIQKNESEIARLLADQEVRIARADSVRMESGGLLAKMEALGVLKEEHETIHLASLFLTLLFLSLETAPIMVKLLSTLNPYRPYDELLAQHESEVVETAKQRMAVRRHELNRDAERMKDEYDDVTTMEFQLSTERHKLQKEAELKANKALMQQVADAQAELAGHLVAEWKRREQEKIKQNIGLYVQGVP